MPVLDTLAKRRVGYANLTDLLAQKGLDIKTDTLRQALHRWRKRQESNPLSDSGHVPTASAPPNGAEQVNSVHSLRGMTVTRPEPKKDQPQLTKARLQEMRKEHVDLDAIIKAGRSVSTPD